MAEKMAASDRLHAAHLSALDGRYEEALAEYVWFHDHALEERPSLYGVRLSFALAYWIELSEHFPKARRVLVEIRNRKTVSLLEGKGDRQLFHDVASINDALGCPEDTYALFVQLDASNPMLAESAAELALPAIVAASDFSLAIRYLPHPENRIIELSESLNSDIADLKARPKSRREHVLTAYIRNYASEVQLISSVLQGNGLLHEAEGVKSLATRLVKSVSAKKAIRNALEVSV